MDDLNKHLKVFSEAITRFPVGATSYDDLKPFEEKIQNIKVILKQMNAKCLKLLAIRDKDNISLSEDDLATLMSNMQLEIAEYLRNRRIMELILQTKATLHEISKDQVPLGMETKLLEYVIILVNLNDSIISLLKTEQKLSKKKLLLEIDCKAAIYDYKDFLQQQKKIQEEHLKKMNPEIAKNKESMMTVIKKINLMKKLITNFIGASSRHFAKDSFFRSMMELHREAITEENILQITEEGCSSL